MDVHVVVRGRVQGVGFRWFVRESARAAGVAGWVKNRSDGTVEVAASGQPAAVETLIDALRQGPAGARVAAVDPLSPLTDSLPSPFTILR